MKSATTLVDTATGSSSCAGQISGTSLSHFDDQAATSCDGMKNHSASAFGVPDRETFDDSVAVADDTHPDSLDDLLGFTGDLDSNSSSISGIDLPLTLDRLLETFRVPASREQAIFDDEAGDLAVPRTRVPSTALSVRRLKRLQGYWGPLTSSTQENGSLPAALDVYANTRKYLLENPDLAAEFGTKEHFWHPKLPPKIQIEKDADGKEALEPMPISLPDSISANLLEQSDAQPEMHIQVGDTILECSNHPLVISVTTNMHHRNLPPVIPVTIPCDVPDGLAWMNETRTYHSTREVDPDHLASHVNSSRCRHDESRRSLPLYCSSRNANYILSVNISVPFYKSWAPMVMRRIQDKFGMSHGQMESILAVLTEMQVPMNRPVGSAFFDDPRIKGAMDQALIQEMVGQTLGCGGGGSGGSIKPVFARHGYVVENRVCEPGWNAAQRADIFEQVDHRHYPYEAANEVGTLASDLVNQPGRDRDAVPKMHGEQLSTAWHRNTEQFLAKIQSGRSKRLGAVKKRALIRINRRRKQYQSKAIALGASKRREPTVLSSIPFKKHASQSESEALASSKVQSNRLLLKNAALARRGIRNEWRDRAMALSSMGYRHHFQNPRRGHTFLKKRVNKTPVLANRSRIKRGLEAALTSSMNNSDIAREKVQGSQVSRDQSMSERRTSQDSPSVEVVSRNQRDSLNVRSPTNPSTRAKPVVEAPEHEKPCRARRHCQSQSCGFKYPLRKDRDNIAGETTNGEIPPSKDAYFDGTGVPVPPRSSGHIKASSEPCQLIDKAPMKFTELVGHVDDPTCAPGVAKSAWSDSDSEPNHGLNNTTHETRHKSEVAVENCSGFANRSKRSNRESSTGRKARSGSKSGSVEKGGTGLKKRRIEDLSRSTDENSCQSVVPSPKTRTTKSQYMESEARRASGHEGDPRKNVNLHRVKRASGSRMAEKSQNRSKNSCQHAECSENLTAAPRTPSQIPSHKSDSGRSNHYEPRGDSERFDQHNDNRRISAKCAQDLKRGESKHSSQSRDSSARSCHHHGSSSLTAGHAHGTFSIRDKQDEKVMDTSSSRRRSTHSPSQPPRDVSPSWKTTPGSADELAEIQSQALVERVMLQERGWTLSCVTNDDVGSVRVEIGASKLSTEVLCRGKGSSFLSAFFTALSGWLKRDPGIARDLKCFALSLARERLRCRRDERIEGIIDRLLADASPDACISTWLSVVLPSEPICRRQSVRMALMLTCEKHVLLLTYLAMYSGHESIPMERISRFFHAGLDISYRSNATSMHKPYADRDSKIEVYSSRKSVREPEKPAPQSMSPCSSIKSQCHAAKDNKPEPFSSAWGTHLRPWSSPVQPLSPRLENFRSPKYLSSQDDGFGDVRTMDADEANNFRSEENVVYEESMPMPGQNDQRHNMEWYRNGEQSNRNEDHTGGSMMARNTEIENFSSRRNGAYFKRAGRADGGSRYRFGFYDFECPQLLSPRGYTAYAKKPGPSKLSFLPDCRGFGDQTPPFHDRDGLSGHERHSAGPRGRAPEFETPLTAGGAFNPRGDTFGSSTSSSASGVRMSPVSVKDTGARFARSSSGSVIRSGSGSRTGHKSPTGTQSHKRDRGTHGRVSSRRHCGGSGELGVSSSRAKARPPKSVLDSGAWNPNRRRKEEKAEEKAVREGKQKRRDPKDGCGSAK